MISINAEGLSCPQPLLKTKQALKNLDLGQVLLVTSTDPASARDFQVFTEHFGYPLVCNYSNGIYTYKITKSGK